MEEMISFFSKKRPPFKQGERNKWFNIILMCVTHYYNTHYILLSQFIFYKQSKILPNERNI